MLMPAVNRAAETRHELLSEPSLEEEKELYRAYEEERIERLYEEEHAKESAAFEMKYGRPPESDEELYSADLSDICFIDNDRNFIAVRAIFSEQSFPVDQRS